ncbi:DUF305 domain-containing protein [Azospirillum sp. 11R-A]|uniref:DUF305 domain-containing protein n=1 Tax=Azospirillum sp. 11R-A TaxID=3111634 RepID=UPI003C1833F1
MTIWSTGKATAFAAILAASLVPHAALADDQAQHESSRHDHSASISDGPEAAYLAANDAAMDRMMADMAAKPTGDIDRDFVAMMTPHHQGAIDMALTILKYGRNEQLKRLAQEIIVEQQQEIAAMKLAIGDTLPPSAPAPTQVSPDKNPAGSMQRMDPNMKM